MKRRDPTPWLPGRSPAARFRILSRAFGVLIPIAAVLLVIGLPAGGAAARWSLALALVVFTALAVCHNLFACPRCGEGYLWKRQRLLTEYRWMAARCRGCGLPSATPYDAIAEAEKAEEAEEAEEGEEAEKAGGPPGAAAP